MKTLCFVSLFILTLLSVYPTDAQGTLPIGPGYYEIEDGVRFDDGGDCSGVTDASYSGGAGFSCTAGDIITFSAVNFNYLVVFVRTSISTGAAGTFEICADPGTGAVCQDVTTNPNVQLYRFPLFIWFLSGFSNHPISADITMEVKAGSVAVRFDAVFVGNTHVVFSPDPTPGPESTAEPIIVVMDNVFDPSIQFFDVGENVMTVHRVVTLGDKIISTQLSFILLLMVVLVLVVIFAFIFRRR